MTNENTKATDSSDNANALPTPNVAPNVAVPPPQHPDVAPLQQQHAQLVHRFGEISLALDELAAAKAEVVSALKAIVTKLKAIL